MTFDPPADGEYLVRVEDVRGLGGEDFGYHLVVRRPRPDFQVSPRHREPEHPARGTALVTVNLTRLDGFDGAGRGRAPRACRRASRRRRR